ncbi:MAG: HD-GYP domain-containing protein [Lachnospiraceae bacterium]|nr:HD-GYP domain-containing protein [Lachnospiraceae bacterium]
MRRTKTTELVPGMILADDVYSYDRSVMILPKGSVLNDKSITRLAFYSILQVLIEDEQLGLEEKQPEPSYAERLRQTPEFQRFQKQFEDEADQFKEQINDVVRHNRPLDVENMMTPVYALVDNSSGPSNVFDMLHSLRQYDDATYVHCINVALICSCLAKWMRLSEEETLTAMQAGLLHDIGKLLIPGEIITKPAKLTADEYHIIQTHPRQGYDILKNLPINDHIKMATLMHHERCDGSGYPLRLTGERIDPVAKIVAIADVYDATTSARVYRGPQCPFVAIALFENEGLQKYDTRAIMTFLSNVVNTYLLNRVRLNNGLEGEIVFINPDHLARPTIKAGNSYIDLAQNPDLYIETIV